MKKSSKRVGGWGPHPDSTVPKMGKSGQGHRKSGQGMNPKAVPDRDYTSGYPTHPSQTK